jgi:hypothetical protein
MFTGDALMLVSPFLNLARSLMGLLAMSAVLYLKKLR